MISTKKLMVKNKNIRAAVETPLARRSVLQSLFYARDKMAEAKRSSWTACSRALEVWDSTQCRKLGWSQKDIVSGDWNKGATASAGLRDPKVDHFNNSETSEKVDAAATPVHRHSKPRGNIVKRSMTARRRPSPPRRRRPGR